MKVFVVVHPRPKKGISQPHACARTHEIPMGMQSDAKIVARGEMCASLLALPAGKSLQALSHACVAARKKPERSEADVTRNGKTTSYHQSINQSCFWRSFIISLLETSYDGTLLNRSPHWLEQKSHWCGVQIPSAGAMLRLLWKCSSQAQSTRN